MGIDNKTFGYKKHVVGFRELFDDDTGECVITNTIKHTIPDIKWEKVWVKNLLFAFDIVSSRAYRVLLYFLENRNYENKVFTNPSMVGRQIGITRQTASKIINQLLENDILKNIDMGYQVNPHIVFNTLDAKKKKITRLDVVESYENVLIDRDKTLNEVED